MHLFIYFLISFILSLLLPEEWNNGGDEFERKHDELNLSDNGLEKS